MDTIQEKNKNQIDGSVSYDNLINQNPIGEIPTPTPPPQTAPEFAGRFDSTLNQANDGIVRAQTEEADKRNDILSRLMKEDTISTQDTFNTAFERAGGNKYLSQLTDASTRLAQLQGQFRSREERVKGRAGQTSFGSSAQQRQIDRERAVEVGNQALLVQSLQGNYDSARQIAKDTADFAYQDKKAELDNLYNQYSAINSVVAQQEAQLIDKERRKLDTLQSSVNAAITSGGASVQEMQQLTNPSTSDSQKLAIAQNIVSRTSSEDRGLDRAIKNASLEKANYELNLLKNPPVGEISPELEKKLENLSSTNREALINANETTKQLQRLQEIIQTTDDIATLTPFTEQGREFQRLALDVADKMARERTGAVVNPEEIKTFKTVLGLTGFNRVISDDKEVMSTLGNFINKHQQTTRSIDPTGEIVNFIDSGSSSQVATDTYLDEITKNLIGGANDLYSAFGVN